MAQFKVGELYDDSFRKLTPQERKDNLQGVMYEGKEKSYTKNLTEDELLDRKEEFAEVGLKLSEMADEKKNFIDHLKLQTKPVTEKSKTLLNAIKFRSEQRFGIIYSVDDQEEGMMYFFDENAYCVDARPLTREERQTKLKKLNS